MRTIYHHGHIIQHMFFRHPHFIAHPDTPDYKTWLTSGSPTAPPGAAIPTPADALPTRNPAPWLPLARAQPKTRPRSKDRQGEATGGCQTWMPPLCHDRRRLPGQTRKTRHLLLHRARQAQRQTRKALRLLQTQQTQRTLHLLQTRRTRKTLRLLQARRTLRQTPRPS